MPVIYTADWYSAVVEAINAHVAGLRGVPEGAWTCRIEIAGDGVSPYVAAGEERHFLVRIDGGRCIWYREVLSEEEEGTVLDYRFSGPAAVFDEIAAGVIDPVDAALHGTVKVRGDMRFLMRQAELVKTLLEAYATGVETTWPLGAPPYVVTGGAGDAATAGAPTTAAAATRGPADA